MKYDPIYKRDSAGGIRVWHSESKFDNGQGYIRSVAGVLDGQMVTSDWKEVFRKNVGRSNETTIDEQCDLEIKSLYKDRLTKGYFEKVEDIDTFDKFKPMLAQKFKKVDWKKTPHVWSQPKLDGIRCLATRHGVFTRQFKEHIAIPHIWNHLKSFFEKNPTAVLDGELYNHKYRDNFNEISSIVRKSKPTEEDIAKSAKSIQYHVYDCVWTDDADAGFNKRLGDIPNDIFTPWFMEEVPTCSCSSDEHLDEVYSAYMEEGYEGQMVRLDIKYEHKRSKSLLKRKEFIDEEFKVLDIKEGQGNWAGMAKIVTVELPNGDTCDAGIKGSMEEMKKLLEVKDTITWGTIRYQDKTPDGKLRFGVMVDYGSGDRVD